MTDFKPQDTAFEHPTTKEAKARYGLFAPAGSGMGATVPKSDYDVCEQENSNLRRHLFWAATRLSPSDLGELQIRLKDKTIREGGIVDEQADEDRAALMEVRRLAMKLADLADAVVATPNSATVDALAGRLDNTANALRNALGPEPAHTLGSLVKGDDHG